MVTAKSLIDGNFTTSNLWLVDLAGSERITKTDVHGERPKKHSISISPCLLLVM
jgi:kinesin family protein C2/C3